MPHHRFSGCVAIASLWFGLALVASPRVAFSSVDEVFLPSQPFSEFIAPVTGEPDHGFCSRWNPEYGYLGRFCCEVVKTRTTRRRGLPKCAPDRIRSTFCSDMTPDQKRYIELSSGQGGISAELFDLIWGDFRTKRTQSYCGVNNGFLAYGRPLVPTSKNRIQIRNPIRCTNFGTDGLVGALDWLGKQVAAEYPAPSQAALNVGDLSAPRGGCIAGRRGRRGHASHTSGLDADVGFFNPLVRGPQAFHRSFDAKSNWWLFKKLFKNPHVCVKVIFIDRRHIRSLSKVAAADPDWQQYRRFIQHVRGHRNHFHVRVGDAPGPAGCNADPVSESLDEDSDERTSGEGAGERPGSGPGNEGSAPDWEAPEGYGSSF